MPANIKLLSQKLPYKLREKWRAKESEILKRDGQRAYYPDIVNFIEQQVRITSDLVFGDIQDTLPVKGVTKPSKSQMKSQLRNSFVTHVSIEDRCKAVDNKNGKAQKKGTFFTKTSSTSCLYCARDGHVLEQCQQLGRKSHREILDFLKEKGLCFVCLNTGHLSKSCNRCITCKQCSQMHIGQKEQAT